ncbi:MAG: HesA/MoeB/ThiF family protein [Duodenibacillus sp.]|nr:HesA/MoeB/ThiF family protein [Duodenibacillus sp.]
MTSTDERYQRHIQLKGWGEQGQARVQRAACLVVGAGGLGSSALLYLAASGVGRLTVADIDAVEVSNLQRQVIHGMDTLGMPKAESAKAAIARLNPGVRVTAVNGMLDDAQLARLVADHDCVVDCTDNSAARRRLSEAARAGRKPLVFAGAVGWDGQLAVFDFRRDDAPCFSCLFPETAGRDLKAADVGVFAPLVGMLGCMQAAEALKLIAGAGKPAAGELLLVDGRSFGVTRLRTRRNPACPACGQGARD